MFYIHPTNRNLRPDAIERSFDPVTKTRSIDWYWNMLLKNAREGQRVSREDYRAFDALRIAEPNKPHGGYFMQSHAIESARARAALFQLIGDGRAWNDPSLNTWEGTP